MRLRTRFLLLFLASGMFLLLEGLAAAWGLRVVGRDVDRLEIYTQTDDICGQIKAELAQLPSIEDLGSPPSGRARQALRRHADRTVILCRSLVKLTSTPNSLHAIAEIESSVVVYRQVGEAYALAQEGGRSGFAELDRAEPAFREVVRVRETGVIEPVGHEARLATKAVVDRANALNTYVTIGGLSLSVVFTVVCAIVLARATAQPIVRLLRAAREVGRGNLDVEVPVVTSDELGELGHAFNDMTDRLRESRQDLEEKVRQRTEELRRREKDLERARKLAAVGRLAAGVAHEVANPLTVIASAAEGLRDRAQDPELARVASFEDFPDYLETIESEAYRLKSIIRRLLDFARPRPTVVQPCDLVEIVHDAVQLARLDPRAREHPIHFMEPKGRFELRGDPDALKEASLNLLFNALDAVRGGGEVAARVGREGGRLLIEVADTGMGIEREDLDRLFEPFFTTKDPGEGTGLGLALVYGTVERHGGTISVQSDGPGQGAVFRVLLPIDGAAE
ncbi:MAG: PAS domain-containing sensor histidine kinase [Planctomycetota bacterium]